MRSGGWHELKVHQMSGVSLQHVAASSHHQLFEEQLLVCMIAATTGLYIAHLHNHLKESLSKHTAGTLLCTLPLQPVNPKSGLAGAAALSALKRSLGGVLEVLLPAYGPGVAQQLVDTSKGYAVLLRQQELPVTAGLLDVYGQVGSGVQV
jgi:hypothetical protein